MATQPVSDLVSDCDAVVAEFESAIADAARPYEQFLQLALELRHLSSINDLQHDRAADFHARVLKATRFCKGKNFSRLRRAAETVVRNTAE